MDDCCELPADCLGKESFALDRLDDTVERAAEGLESAVDGRKGNDVEEAISLYHILSGLGSKG